MRARLAFVLAFGFGILFAGDLRADAPEPASAAAPSVTAEGLLSAADAAVEGGDLKLARALFERLTAEFPLTSQASEARRALRILDVQGRMPPAPGEASTDQIRAADGNVVVRNEPYSLKTSERLRLTIWEKVDFSVTSFLYGMSVGLSFSLSSDAQTTSGVLTPIALGAIAYTVGSVAFLKLANPDRGDLPLALAITSYVPTTTLLLMSAADPDASSRTVGTATAIAGVASIPMAVLAARTFDLDPGDTQLVRDAGFWGLALGTLGTLGFAGTSSDYQYGSYREPSGRKVAVGGLAGLYGGLGLGLLGASLGEVSLERVRVTTWGGYGGAVVGLLLGASASNNRNRARDIYRGTAFGALAGLAITFFTTGSLDGIPAEESKRTSWHHRLTPTMLQLTGSNGSVHPGLGIGGTL
jgi:hypothetical protein